MDGGQRLREENNQYIQELIHKLERTMQLQELHESNNHLLTQELEASKRKLAQSQTDSLAKDSIIKA